MALQIYKKGQGFYTRVGSAAGIGILTAMGCWALSNTLSGFEYSNPDVKTSVQYGVPALVLIILGSVLYWILNRPNIADFMIATEGEMKKVSWSTKKEIIASTKVVIFVVILMGLLLAGVDLLFMWFFESIGVLQGFESEASSL